MTYRDFILRHAGKLTLALLLLLWGFLTWGVPWVRGHWRASWQRASLF